MHVRPESHIPQIALLKADGLAAYFQMLLCPLYADCIAVIYLEKSTLNCCKIIITDSWGNYVHLMIW